MDDGWAVLALEFRPARAAGRARTGVLEVKLERASESARPSPRRAALLGPKAATVPRLEGPERDLFRALAVQQTLLSWSDADRRRRGQDRRLLTRHPLAERGSDVGVLAASARRRDDRAHRSGWRASSAAAASSSASCCGLLVCAFLTAFRRAVPAEIAKGIQPHLAWMPFGPSPCTSSRSTRHRSPPPIATCLRAPARPGAARLNPSDACRGTSDVRLLILSASASRTHARAARLGPRRRRSGRRGRALGRPHVHVDGLYRRAYGAGTSRWSTGRPSSGARSTGGATGSRRAA